MDESDLRARVDAPVEVYDRAPNTDEQVRQWGHGDAPEGALALANELTAARGRSGDDWSAPPGGVWCSVLLRPDLPASSVGRLTLAGGLAVLDAVSEHGVDAGLKWPNDVVVDRGGERRKLAGVLLEPVVDGVPVPGKPVDEVLDGGGELEFVVLGVGVNADLDPADLGVDRPVTTMRAEVGDVDRVAVAADVHERVLARAESVEHDDEFAALLEEYRDVCVTLGERVRAERRDGTTLEGDAVDVDATGALVVGTGNGRETVSEGECERVRRE
jgi:BirA family biotin operon repressor/biotin-[acetyl-CoA-carboxylase] ligase